jgi:PhoH-like ATPase
MIDIELYKKHLDSLSNTEIKALLIKAGIYDENMHLTPGYKGGSAGFDAGNTKSFPNITYKVLDTNIPLLDADLIVALGSPNVVVVLPETTLDELDAKKSGLNELAFQSRDTTRLLKSGIKQPSFFLGDNIRVAPRTISGNVLWAVSLVAYPEYANVDPKILNDRKIMEVALQLSEYYKGTDDVVEFITNDMMCELRAESLGITVTDFKVVDRVDYEFTRTIEVDDDTFRALHGKNIKDIDPNHLIENYNYKFTTPASSQMKLASINNETINILGKETEAELRKQDVNPSNADQLLLSRAIQDPTMDLIVCEALAGSGKTLVSLSNAIRLVKSKSPYNSILYIRASINDVEAIEEVGFLPGSAEEKNSVYFHPLHDSLDYIARNKFSKGQTKGKELEAKIEEYIEKIIEDCNILPMTGLGMRGRSFNDSIVIIDECQGMSKSSLQKVNSYW